MDVEQIRSKIKAIITNVTDIDGGEIGDSASFVDDLGLDSLSLLEIGVNMDYEFKLELPDEALKDLASVDQAVELVQKRLHEGVVQIEVA